MPKSYLTLAERQKAEAKKFNNTQDNFLQLELLKAKKNQHLTYNDLYEKTKISTSTLQKIFNLNRDLNTVKLETLRKICFALGVKLKFCTE